MAQELRAFVALTEGPVQSPIFTWWLYSSSSELIDTRHTHSTHMHACMQNIHKSFLTKYILIVLHILYSYGQKVCLLGHQNRHLINLFAFFSLFHLCMFRSEVSINVFLCLSTLFYETVSH